MGGGRCHSEYATRGFVWHPGFAAENPRKLPATAAISGAVKHVPAGLALGIGRNARNITVEATARWLLLLGGLAEPILRWTFTRTAAKAHR
ncbi:hypothetical protein ART_1977 [Arthrobacter sp. PAMC 25486]|uniref:hypothetical protein n=1 Tax=Arthrobacter sp. PAMC 25486 TaxID=1494608 RepID=UPI0005364170|nr:hypothetical protein [Arthrobacter sp. PAMC 25486]AIY01576.1 hypothetical protein ART_1977 [Arthrobacter sp. PAMC 25486]